MTALITKFLEGNVEDGDFNQYWYSPFTIDRMVEDMVQQATIDGRNDYKIAFLSTPSLYFSLPEEIRKNSFVFDYDKKWDNDRGFVFYDFNSPEVVPADLLGSCDMVVIDPPFITRDVWEKYAISAKLLLKKETGQIIGTTVYENAAMLAELLEGVKPTNFLPSIPNLVYQYNLYTNYESVVFDKKNPEIIE
jgi:hypothetical protein